MKAIRARLPCIVSVAVILLLIGVVYLLAFDPLVSQYKEQAGDIQHSADQIARLQRLVAEKPVLKAALQKSNANAETANLYFSDKSDTLAATALQKRVKDLVEDNGAKLLSTQKLSKKTKDPFVPVAIRVHMSGQTDAITRTLHALESQQPMLFIDNVQVQSRQRRKTRREGKKRIVETNTDLTVNFQVTGYMREAQGNES